MCVSCLRASHPVLRCTGSFWFWCQAPREHGSDGGGLQSNFLISVFVAHDHWNALCTDRWRESGAIALVVCIWFCCLHACCSMEGKEFTPHTTIYSHDKPSYQLQANSAKRVACAYRAAKSDCANRIICWQIYNYSSSPRNWTTYSLIYLQFACESNIVKASCSCRFGVNTYVMLRILKLGTVGCFVDTALSDVGAAVHIMPHKCVTVR